MIDMKIMSKLFMIVSLLAIFGPQLIVGAQSSEESNDHLPANLIYESQDLEAFDTLTVDLVSSYIEVQKGDNFKIEVFVSQEDLDFDDVFKLTSKNQEVILNEKDWKNNLKSFLTTLTSRVVVTVPETEKLALKVDLVNGEVKVLNSLSELKFDGPNVNLFLKGKETYPMGIDVVNGEIELVFEAFNAELNFEFVNGRFEIMGDTMSATFSDFKKTLGEGRDAIQIDAVNGKVIIKEAE